MLENVYMFATQDSETKEGTAVIINFLQQLFPKDSFVNVEDILEYRIKDVDYIWKHGEREFLLEIKVDSYTTNNLFYEKYSNHEAKTIGAMEKTEADYIAYYYPNKGTLYMIDPKALRKYVNKYEKWLEPKFVKNTTFHSMGYKVPLSELGDNIIKAKFENVYKELGK